MTGSWGELLGREHGATAVVLASGVALYAMNVYVTSALLPSAVRDLGGNSYYAWALTSFLIASVVASMLVNQMLGRFGARRVYGITYAIFAAGSLLNAVTPDMAGLVIGRAVQGVGGGLLAGLGYAVLRRALPERLWTRAAGLVSAMWGVGNLIGPALGGGFAQIGWWRGAFFLLVAASVVLAVIAQRALPNVRGTVVSHRFPLRSVVVLSAAAAAFSVSSVVAQRSGMVLGTAGGVLLLVVFVVVDRRAGAGGLRGAAGSRGGRAGLSDAAGADPGGASVLPRAAYARHSPLPWIFLTVAGLSAGGMADNFVPLFGQRLAGMAPIVAGFMGAALSMGWTVGQLGSVNLQTRRSRRIAVVVGPVLLTCGLVIYGLLQRTAPPLTVEIGWVLALLMAGGGIGIAFPHMSIAAMSSAEDPVEGAKAATGVNTTQLIANTMAAAYAGVLVSFGAPSEVASARWMAFGLAVVTALTVWATVASRAPR